MNGCNGSGIEELFETFDSSWADSNPPDNRRDNSRGRFNNTKQIKSAVSPKDAFTGGKKKEPTTKAEKKIRDDHRRRKSLIEKSSINYNQQLIVSAALSNVGSAASNINVKKIVFTDDSEGVAFNEIEADRERNNTHIDEFTKRENMQEDNFSGDDRFRMDDRFMEDYDPNAEMPNEENKQLFMKRYVQNGPLPNYSDIKKSKRMTSDLEKPVVTSNDKFYKVSQNFKRDTNQSFSVLEMYGEESKSTSSFNEDSITAWKIENEISDYSSDEDGEANIVPRVQNDIKQDVNSVSTSATESFFLLNGDPRIKDGFEFMNKKFSTEAKETTENFDNIRKLLKEIVRRQVNRRLKKNDMFKKKIGGMSRPKDNHRHVMGKHNNFKKNKSKKSRG